MLDWGIGSYESTAGVELAPAADALVDAARIDAGEEVVDLACGSGNAALRAAERGARVIGIDGAPRLLEVAAERAASAGLTLDLREGDLLALPVPDGCADVLLSVFGVIFAADAVGALREVRRVLRPKGRAVVSAWVPQGPINEMLQAVGRIVARVTGATPEARFAWSDPAVLGPAAAQAGLRLQATTRCELEIRATSAESYLERNRAHPMVVTGERDARDAGVLDEIHEAQLEVVRTANEDSGGFLVHSPYVLHQLQPAR